MTDDLDMLKRAPEAQEAALFDRAAEIVEAARSHVTRTVNTTMVQAYWLIGREIVEVEQGGEARAGYGDEVVKRLSRRMTARYGKGFTPTSIKRMRQFYLAFPNGSRLPEVAADTDKGAAPRHPSDGDEMSAAPRHLSPTITAADLEGLPGLRRAAVDAILAGQPQTVAELIRLPDVGRKTVRALLEAGLLTDPDDAMHRSIYHIPATSSAAIPGVPDDGHPS